MSRFSKEFFGGDPPSHDELVSMAIDNRDGILRRILPKILRSRQMQDIISVYLCPKGERPPWCTSDIQTAFRTDPLCLVASEEYIRDFVDSSIGELKLPSKLRLCPETTWARHELTPEDICIRLNDVCESGEPEKDFIDFYWGEISIKSRYPDGKYIHSVLPNYDQIIRPPTYVLESYKVEWEPEKIVKRDTGFIFGYADVELNFELKIRKDFIISDIETWRRYDYGEVNLRVVVEAKPKLTSWGAPLRQLKTYMDLLKPRFSQTRNNFPIAGVISTFSRIPRKIHKILEKENVYVITFTKKGEISDGFAPEQKKL